MATIRRSASTFGRGTTLCFLIALMAALTACSAEPTPAPTPVAEPKTAATPDPVESPDPAGFWRTDAATGSAHGERAANVSLTLLDGSTTTLEAAAGGRAVLLYSFASW